MQLTLLAAQWPLLSLLKSMPSVIATFTIVCCVFKKSNCSFKMCLYFLEENEERSMVEPRSMDDPKLIALIGVLVEWINDELAEHRIIVQNVDEDLYDGQVLQKLLGMTQTAGYIFNLLNFICFHRKTDRTKIGCG